MCREILGTQQNGGQVEQVEQVSIESVAFSTAGLLLRWGAKPDKLRSINKPMGWNSFLKVVTVRRSDP